MLSERRQKGMRSLELIQNGQVPLNVTKLVFFCFDTHTQIFSGLTYEMTVNSFNAQG